MILEMAPPFEGRFWFVLSFFLGVFRCPWDIARLSSCYFPKFRTILWKFRSLHFVEISLTLHRPLEDSGNVEERPRTATRRGSADKAGRRRRSFAAFFILSPMTTFLQK